MECKRSERYFYPDGNIYLQTEEGETLFRLPSYVLRTISTVFNDMLSLKGLVPASTDTSSGGGLESSCSPPITIDGTCAAVEMLLDFALKEEVDSLGSWPLIGSAYHLAAKYEFGVARGRITSRLMQLVKTAPWDTFVLAAQYDRLLLGRLALAHMGDERQRDVTLVSHMPYDEGARLPVAWLLPYMAIAAKIQYESRHSSPSSCPTWAKCAADFKPGVSGGRAVAAVTAPQHPAPGSECPFYDELDLDDELFALNGTYL